ncbi:patatin-like phospholipase family protein [Trinickia sp.]|uniref:patatin-like phospholipase family protein n=1 Tax=Trinickia sp. TaxID=2571163 RepID=UPI003F810FD0
MDENEAGGSGQPHEGGTVRTGIAGQVVLVLQGGGALGAYQAGVYQALHDAGIEPDWVIGTSIGAVNGAIIAGNPPDTRLARLDAFWSRVAAAASVTSGWLPAFDDWWRRASIFLQGIPAFFTPSPSAWWALNTPLGREHAAFYTTQPLRETLHTLVDFDYLNACNVRLTVGAVHVADARMRYFTNRDAPLSVEHVMASAAFPPGFPSVEVDGESYWDGGIYSNTPLEAVLDDRPRRSSVIFAVQLWPTNGREPQSIVEAMVRQRDIQYSSRSQSHLERQRQIHRLRHVIRELEQYIAEPMRETQAVRDLLAWGCGTTMQVIELDAPSFGEDDLHKDIDFSPGGIERRRTAGYDDTRRMLARAPWRETMDPMEGIAVHRAAPGA